MQRFFSAKGVPCNFQGENVWLLKRLTEKREKAAIAGPCNVLAVWSKQRARGGYSTRGTTSNILFRVIRVKCDMNS